MTKSIEDNDEIGGEDSLLHRLSQASTDQVADASAKVGAFSVDDDENDRRKSKADVRRTLHTLRIGFYRFMFVAVCLMVTICSIGYLYLVGLWLGTVLYGTKLHDPVALKSFIDSVLWSLLIVFATLFFEGTFKDEER